MWGDERAQETGLQRRSVPVRVPASKEIIDQAKEFVQQAGVSGEIGFVQHLAKENRLSISVMKPGERTTIDVDL